VSHTVFAKWFVLPQLFYLMPIPLACAAAFIAARAVIRRPEAIGAGREWVVFASTVLIFVLAFVGLAFSIYPFIVIDRMTVWQAASSTEALTVIFIGVAVTLPVIVGYTIFMYRVFGGKARELSYGL
jgi:cytochrome d ubiquinol oxidase subunit II